MQISNWPWWVRVSAGLVVVVALAAAVTSYIPASRVLGWIDVREHGALCNGVRDDTAAIQRAITAGRTGDQGGVLTLPVGGTCVVSAPLVLANLQKFELVGNNANFLWNGATTGAMFLLQDVRESHFHHFRITSSASKHLQYAIQIENSTGAGVTPTANVFEHIAIEGTTAAGLTTAIRIAQGSGGDENNDFHQFHHVIVNNYSQAAVSIEHSQSKTHVFEDFGWAANGSGQYGIQVNTRGSFRCVRCYGGGTTVADFSIPNVTDNILISQGNFEGSKRLLIIPNTGGPSFAVMIETTRWAADGLHADGNMIQFGAGGPLYFINNLIDAGTKSPRILFNNSNNPYATIRGNSVSPVSYSGTLQPLRLMNAGLSDEFILESGNRYVTSTGGHWSPSSSGDDYLKPAFVDIRRYGAICDALLHPLSLFFSTLAEAQSIYPHAAALTNQLDWAALQGALNEVAEGGTVVLPTGVCVMGDTSPIVGRSVTLAGQGWWNNLSGMGGTVLRTSANSTGVGLAFDLGIGIKTFHLRDLLIDGQATTVTCLQVGGGGGWWIYSSISNVNLMQCTNGFSMQAITKSVFTHLTYSNNTTDLLRTGTPPDNTFVDGESIFLMGNTCGELSNPFDGTLKYCTDCTIANPCGCGGTGALAKRMAGVWVCN